MELRVRDDGHGLIADDADRAADECTVEPAPAGSTVHSSVGEAAGTGLRGISERLSAVGGTLKLRPDAHPGFLLIATVPAAREAAEEPAPATAGGQATADGPDRVTMAG
jgi:signal transduction histidine kinase